jgi:imidazolonepropionase-like amidohydrolase
MFRTSKVFHRYLPALFVFFLTAALFLPPANAQSASPASDTIVLSDVRVIDGQGGAPLEHGAVEIQGDHILWVGPAAEAHWPKSARVVNLSGKTVLPGLISDHSHVGQVDGTQLGSQNYTRVNILRQLRQYEVYGITTVTALGMNGDLFYELRAPVHAGALPGADLFGADRGIGIPSGAPPNPPFNLPPTQLYRVTTPQGAVQAVDEMATRKPDFIKVWVDDIQGTLPVKMSPEIYGAAIVEAHRLGLRTASHIYDLSDAKSLVQRGVDIIAHGVRDQPVDADFIAAMKSRPVWYIPTIAQDDASFIFAEHPDWLQDPFVAHALQSALAAQFADPAWRVKTLANQKQIATAHAAVLTNERNVKTLFDAGVPIGFGTDSGASPSACQALPNTANCNCWWTPVSPRCKPSTSPPQTPPPCCSSATAA